MTGGSGDVVNDLPVAVRGDENAINNYRLPSAPVGPDVRLSLGLRPLPQKEGFPPFPVAISIAARLRP